MDAPRIDAPAALHVREIPYRDPLAAFAPFAGRPHAVLLDSALVVEGLGRHAFIAVDPFRTIASRDRTVRVDGVARPDSPFDVLRQEIARYPVVGNPDLPPFQTGLAGYFGYDLGRHLERIPLAATDDMGFPDLAAGLYDVVAAFDLVDRRAWVFSSGHPETDPDARHARAVRRADDMADRLAAAPDLSGASDAGPAGATVESNFTRPDYEAAVQQVIDYIFAGDIFQANLSQRFRATLADGDTPFALYRRLRAGNAAPFAAYLNWDDVVIASSSPERFLRLRDGAVETRPIKGTRPRGADPAQDDALMQALLASEKDRAENVMIVDLLRNDLSRTCRDDSVEVPELCVAETYATVFHLVSTVTGRLRDDAGAVDLLAACFPGGSITGAPKIRAMEIIAELEPSRRGPYCGSIGYIGFDGTMDTNIAIRTYAIKGDTVVFQAGGGIVADSDPADEYDETLAKARALMAALARDVRFDDSGHR